MAIDIEIHRDRGAVPDHHWDGDRTVAVVVGREGEAVTGSVTLLDLGAADTGLRFVALPEATEGALVPLMRAAAQVVREAGGTVLRWVAEADDMPAHALAELGATEGEEVYRWWELGLPAADLPAVAPDVRVLPAPEEAVFRLGLEDAWYDVELDGATATLVHDREEESTDAALGGLLSAVLHRVRDEHPGVRTAETYAAPDDDTLNAALTALGFHSTQRRAVEYHLPLI